jgi:hypothetical protein
MEDALCCSQCSETALTDTFSNPSLRTCCGESSDHFQWKIGAKLVSISPVTSLFGKKNTPAVSKFVTRKGTSFRSVGISKFINL